MTIRLTRRELVRIAGASALAWALPAAAQEAYPSRPLRLVVPFPPGALTDLLGRAVGERLAKALGQSAVIDNKPGAGTLVGAELVAKAAPDGHTLLISTSSTFGIAPALYKNAPIDPLRDFQPVSLLGTVNFFLIASNAFQPNRFATWSIWSRPTRASSTTRRSATAARTSFSWKT